MSNFKLFFKDLNTNLKCYHSGLISEHYEIPSDLQQNIHNYGHFVDTFEKLVKSKLYIWVEKGYNQRQMFYNYILPTSVFLHYLNLDISKLSEISIYIVNHETYDSFKENIGGQYCSGRNKRTNNRNHLLFIKDYKATSLMNKETSLISLFHELTHLIDNSDYNGLNDANNVDYEFKWFEIKAKMMSEFLLGFYNTLSTGYQFNDRLELINDWIYFLKDYMIGISETIETFLLCNNECLELENHSEYRSSQLITTYSKSNISYYRSMQVINTLNNFFNKMVDKLV